MPQLTLSPATLQLLSPIIPLVTEDSDKSGFFNFTSSADTFTSSLNTSFALNMQAGDDTVNLNGRGDDSIFTGSGNDTVYAGRGADNVEGGSGTDRLYGEEGYDVLLGGGDADLLYGGADGDDLFGNSGNDSLYGEAGRDFLAGGQGTDWLTGGGDADTFWFDDGNLFLGHGDIITDFSHADGDKIDLRAIDANTALAGDQAFRLVSGPTSELGTMWLTQSDGDTWWVSFNTTADADLAHETDFNLIITTAYVPGSGFPAPVASDFLF